MSEYAGLVKRLQKRREWVNAGGCSSRPIPDKDCVDAAGAITALQTQLDAARRDAYNDVITEFGAAALLVSSQTEAAIYRRVVANVKAMRDAAIDAALQDKQP